MILIIDTELDQKVLFEKEYLIPFSFSDERRFFSDRIIRDPMQMKRILLISYNFSPELTGIGKYNGEMMEWLAARGYDCSVITAYPYYPHWKVQDSYARKRFFFSREDRRPRKGAGRLTVFRCPMYVPAQPSGIRRILLEVSFFAAALVRLIGLLMAKRFDFVIAVAPAFHVGLLGLLYQTARRSKFLYHVQDLQIDAARELKMIRSNTALKAMQSLERFIVRNAHFTSSISPQMVDKVKAKGARNTFLFPNWTDIDQFYPIENRTSFRDEFGFNESHKIVLYSGAIGEKQGLELILFSALAHRDNKQLKFIICGDGPYKKKLEEDCDQLGLTNVYFLGLQPYRSFNRFLNAADIHLIIQKTGASDLVMPSKLGAILAVGGLALITANRGTALHDLVEKHNIGFVIDCEDQKALDDAIGKLVTGDHKEIRENARRYAVECLSIGKVMSDFERWLNGGHSEQLPTRRSLTKELEHGFTQSHVNKLRL